MDDYRERLENAGLFPAFDQARKAKDKVALNAVLKQAKFSEMEIESLVWSNGDIPELPTPEEKRKNLIDGIIGRIGIAIITGCVFGGVFVYFSLRLHETDTFDQRADQLMSDYRTPKEAIQKPFIWGFGVGTILGLIAGEVVLLNVLSATFKNKDR